MTDTPTVTISFKDMPVKETVREILDKGCRRIAEEFPEIVRVEITLSPDGIGHTAHARVTGSHLEVASHATGVEVGQAADRLLDTLERQLRKNHDKRVFAQRREAQIESRRKRG